jgi:hypothetical protein
MVALREDRAFPDSLARATLLLRTTRPPSSGQDCAEAVDCDVFRKRRDAVAPRSLKEFVDQRIGNGNQKPQQRPIEPPAWAWPAQRTEYRNAEYGKFDDKREFANTGVQMTDECRGSVR